MAISKDFLDSIFSSDSLGLIDKVELPKKSVHEDFDVGDSKRKEIQDWMELHNREPDYNSKDPTEKMLAARLRRIKADSTPEPKNNDDPLHSEVLDKMIAAMGDDRGIHDFTDSILKRPGEKKQAEYTAKRTPVRDFKRYEPMFQQVQAEIDSKQRLVVPFSAHGMKEGRFYIAGGLLCYVDELFEKELNSFGRRDNRMHIVFANGTESYMLFATFQKIMSAENGRSVTEVLDKDLDDFQLDGSAEKDRRKFSAPDIETGYIYILRTTSDEPLVKQYGGRLYKVGYTSKTVEERIRNAENEPTYLCAPVVIEETWKCININGRKLETFLHNFFEKAQVKIKVNANHQSQVASEWFNVPLETLEQAVPLIINGDIRNWRYDHASGKLIRRR